MKQKAASLGAQHRLDSSSSSQKEYMARHRHTLNNYVSRVGGLFIEKYRQTDHITAHQNDGLSVCGYPSCLVAFIAR